MCYCTIRAPNPAAPRRRGGQNIGRVIVTGTGAGDYDSTSGICSKERTLGYSANSRGGLRGVYSCFCLPSYCGKIQETSRGVSNKEDSLGSALEQAQKAPSPGPV